MNKRALDQFVDAWGSVGALMGFNPSTARVHALLIASDEPICLDDISERLQISRGNASMCLKELRNWGVAKRVAKASERRDFFTSEEDVWKMAFSIARERKRRDFDPALRGVHEAIAELKPEDGSPAAERVRAMATLLTTLDQASSHLLASDEAAKSLFALFGAALGKPES